MTADDALAAALAADAPDSERDAAAEWLGEVLADGPMRAKEVKKAAGDAGHSWATIRRAKGTGGVQVRKEGFGNEGRWIWALRGSPEP
jgi:putative DNA primase/helicase